MARTPLYAAHAALGATFTEFAGYEMPVHYGSIKEEHRTVREAVGLFDVSHMGNLWLSDADDAVARCTPSDPRKVADGRCKYTVLLREDGTILDDTIYGRYGDRLHMVPNAGMAGEVAAHLENHGATVTDATEATAILAVQGPKAPDLLRDLGLEIEPFRIRRAELDGVELGVSGTGYTGEKGAELMFDARHANDVWDRILAAGAAYGIRPIGLGARDTLRLEKGYCLAGHEFAGGRTPLEANLAWLMSWDHDFLGKAALLAQKEVEHDLLWGLRLDRGIPREGHIVERDGVPIGTITSGTMSPTLGKGIGLAYLRGASEGDTVQVRIRDRLHDATVHKPPFV